MIDEVYRDGQLAPAPSGLNTTRAGYAVQNEEIGLSQNQCKEVVRRLFNYQPATLAGNAIRTDFTRTDIETDTTIQDGSYEDFYYRMKEMAKDK
jgi:hypothetical protein